MPQTSKVNGLKSLGPVPEKWLDTVGIHTKEDLEQIGPKGAFEMIKMAGFHPTANVLYALMGALSGGHWVDIAEQMHIEDLFEENELN